MSGAIKHKKILRDNIRGITKPALMRLAYKAGITRMSGLMFDSLRAILKENLETLLNKATVLTQTRRAVTVSGDDVRKAAALLGVKLVETDTKATRSFKHGGRAVHSLVSAPLAACGSKPVGKSPKQRYSRKGVAAERFVRYYQKNSGSCFSIPRLSFSRFAREILQDFDLGELHMRLSHEADVLIQSAMEAYIVDILRRASLVTMARGQKTVMFKDLKVARYIRH